MSKLTVTPAGSLEGHSTFASIVEYRSLVTQRYTACPPVEIGRYLSQTPYISSRKIDGELWFIDTHSSPPRLIAGNGRVAHGDHELLDAAAKLPKDLIIAGELYVPNSGRERVGDVAKALSGGGTGLHFAAFDIVEAPEASWQQSAYADRLAKLKELLPDEKSALSTVATEELSSEADVLKLFNETVVAGGSEGIIVRCHDGRILKIKQSITVDAVVLAFTTEQSPEGVEQVRSVLFGLALPDGDFVPVGATGNFEAAFSKVDLLKVLKPLEISSGYRQAAASGQLYRFVKPQIILESQVLDVQSLDSQGRRIKQVKLSLNDSGWVPGLKVPAASLINAVVVRERSDKPDVLSGSRWEQIAEFAELPATAGEALPQSEVVRREVWVKQSADKTDVRKLVVFKTNKEEVDPLYPAFVVHWTDFSVGRKAPLAREVKPAPDQKTANEIADSLIEENIKKGWEKQAG